LTKSEKLRYLSQFAYAFEKKFENDFENATLILVHIEEQVNKSRILCGRLAYLISSLLIVICNLFVLYFLYPFELKPDINKTIDFSFLYIISTFGSFGGFLSIAISNKALKIDADTKYLINSLYGISRILISMICSIIVYLLIKSNLLLGALNAQSDIYIILSFACLAGFCEKFIPNTFAQLEMNVGKQAFEMKNDNTNQE
jgi:hypothetical protein